MVEARLDEAQKIFDIDREQYEEYIGPFAFGAGCTSTFVPRLPFPMRIVILLGDCI